MVELLINFCENPWWIQRQHLQGSNGRFMRDRDLQKQAIQMPVESKRNLNGHQSCDSSLRDGNGSIQLVGTGEVDSAGKSNLLKRGPKRKGKYVGICYDRHARKWRAFITIKSNQKHLGCFDKPETAAKIYDTWARRLHGSKATLNFP